MLFYGKTSAVAVASLSFLAEHFKSGTSFTSLEIAQARQLTQAHVAKILTQLAPLGLVTGRRGPNGGYRLAKPPSTISIAEIITPFEQSRSNLHCPFGPDWCGHHDPCPLHFTLAKMMENNLQILRGTFLDVFAQNLEASLQADAS